MRLTGSIRRAREWNSTEFHVSVNPELGLVLDGQRYAIKVFLNRNKLSKLKAQTAGLLMHQAFGQNIGDTKYAILDVKADTIHTFAGASDKLHYLLIGEAAHLSAMISAIRNND